MSALEEPDALSRTSGSVRARGRELPRATRHRTGYCLLYKRLERGTFRVPQALEPGARSVAIEAAEMAKILEGISLPPSKQRVRAPAA